MSQDHHTLSVKTLEQFEELRDTERTYEKVPYRHHFLCPECDEESSIYATHKRPNGDYIYYRQCNTCDLKFKTVKGKRGESIFESGQSSDPKVTKSFASFHWWAISDSRIEPVIRQKILDSLKRVKKELEIEESFTFKPITGQKDIT